MLKKNVTEIRVIGRDSGTWPQVGSCLSRRLPFPPLCSPVLEPDLNPGFAQAELQGQLLSGEDVRVRSPLKGSLELLQLVSWNS